MQPKYIALVSFLGIILAIIAYAIIRKYCNICKTSIPQSSPYTVTYSRAKFADSLVTIPEEQISTN